MSETIEFTENLPCGHHRSLLVKSVESDYQFCELCETKDRLRDALNQEKSWMETARQHCRNEEFYRDIVTSIGELFGDAAKTSDDGTLQQDVLALNVLPLVKKFISDEQSFSDLAASGGIAGAP